MSLTIIRLYTLSAAVGVALLLPGALNNVLESGRLSGGYAEQAKEPSPEVSMQDIFAGYISDTYGKSFEYSKKIVEITFIIAEAYSIQPSLLLAMMAKESAFELNAVSNFGALGLMQVVPRFHLDKLKSGEDVSSLREPGPNIRVAAEVLTGYLAKEGSLDRALIKYSGNSPNYPARVRRYWEKLKAIESEARRQEVPFSTPDV